MGTKEFKKQAKEAGFTSIVKYNRIDTHSISYEVQIFNDGYSCGIWDGHYFIGEINSPNSKESMIKDWEFFLKKKVIEINNR